MAKATSTAKRADQTPRWNKDGEKVGFMVWMNAFGCGTVDPELPALMKQADANSNVLVCFLPV